MRGSFGSRLTVALLAAALLPLISLGVVLAALGAFQGAPALPRLILLAGVLTGLLALLFASFLGSVLTAPLRAIAAAVDRVSAGDLSTPIVIEGDDELARLAESHNRLAADLDRRNHELNAILVAIDGTSADAGIEALLERAGAEAREVFGMIDARIRLVDPKSVPVEERIPGEALPVRAELRAGDQPMGLLTGHLPATRRWERADADLLGLFASEMGVALRNAELFAEVEAQNARLRKLDLAKDDFLRGVSHNLQTPLTSIQACADQLAGGVPDRRLTIIREQAERLSRMVRQLLTVSRLESGTVRPRTEIVALGPRIRRAWEALGAASVAFSLRDDSAGWLAIADPDQLDQVLWAVLDNAVRYGEGTPINVTVTVEVASNGEPDRLRVRVDDRGPGVHEDDRTRLFGRYQRGAASPGGESDGHGSGLGLYVSRALMRAMDGDLACDDDLDRMGASFSLWLPAETAQET
jgi:signal transduction histidine kinase